MATREIPTLQNQGTDLQALINAFTQPQAVPSTGNSSSATNPAFVPEMGALWQSILGGTSPWNKQSAITDITDTAANMARTMIQNELPGIARVPRVAGAYNSTTADLLKNDLASRTSGAIASAVQQNILNYGQLEQGLMNGLANMSRAGTSQFSNSNQTGQGVKNNSGLGAALGLGAQALGGMGGIGGILGKLFGGGGAQQGITSIMGMEGPSWTSALNSGLGNSYFDLGGAGSLGTGDYSSLPGYGYTGTSGGITDYMNSIGGGGGGGGGGLLSGIMDSVSGIGSSIGDWFGDLFSFADGGKIPGQAPAARGEDNVTIQARSGEFVMIPEAVEALGEDFFDKINSAFMPASLKKGGTRDQKNSGKLPSFAVGGKVGGSLYSGQFTNYVDPTLPAGFARGDDLMSGGFGARLGELAGDTGTAPSWVMSDLDNHANWASYRTSSDLTTGLGLDKPGGQLAAALGRTGDGTYNPAAYTGSYTPTYDFSNPGSAEYQTSLDALKAGNSMDAGWNRSGVNAFLKGDINFWDQSWNAAEREGNPLGQDSYLQGRTEAGKELLTLAHNLGFDTSGFDVNSWSSWENRKGAGSLGTQPKGIFDLYQALNKDLEGFSRRRTASAGWDGQNNMRGTAETLYFNDGSGKHVAIDAPRFGQKREHQGWAKEEGSELIAAMSMVLPAVGGWAGLLGQAGSSYAPLINAAGGYLTTGNPASLLGALGSNVGSWAGGQVGSSLGSSSGLFSSLGGKAGEYLAKSLYSNSQQKR